MSIQDSIFDVAAALKGKPEEELFDEILKALTYAEETSDHFCKNVVAIRGGIEAWKNLFP